MALAVAALGSRLPVFAEADQCYHFHTSFIPQSDLKVALALFVTNQESFATTHQPISRNTLSESRNLNSFLPSSISNDRDPRWAARTVSMLVSVAQEARECVLSHCSTCCGSLSHRCLRSHSLWRNRDCACSLASYRHNLEANEAPTGVYLFVLVDRPKEDALDGYSF
jgi:hypothetical protein